MKLATILSVFASAMILVSAESVLAKAAGPGDGGGGDPEDMRVQAATISSPLADVLAQREKSKAELDAEKRREAYVKNTRNSLALRSKLLVHYLNILIGLEYPIELPVGEGTWRSEPWLQSLQWIFARDTEKTLPEQLFGPGSYSFLKTAKIEVSDEPLFLKDKNGKDKRVTFISYPDTFTVKVDGRRMAQAEDWPEIFATILHEYYVLHRIENSLEYKHSLMAAKAIADLRNNVTYQQYALDTAPILVKSCREIYQSPEQKKNLKRAAYSAESLLLARVITETEPLLRELTRKSATCQLACAMDTNSRNCQLAK